ncbi:MAG: glycosyltransferase [Geobacter sp.]|nr:glycosyltransferase [Geobacter sp.]
MKTLVIASQYPLPENGGNRIRTMNFVRYFRKLGDVDLAWYQDSPEDTQPDPVFRRQFPLVRKEATRKQGRLQGLYEQIRYSKPWIVSSYSEENVQELKELIEQGDYDHIVCRYAVSAYPLLFLSEQNRKKVIVDIDDIMTPDLYGTVHGSLSGIRKIRSYLDMKIYEKYQSNCARIGKALVCSRDDQRLLSKRAAGASIHVVPNIAPNLQLPAGYQSDGFRNSDTLLFVGNLGYQPNIAGLEWFVTSVFSPLIAENDRIRLLVAGKDPNSRVKNLCTQYAQIQLIENPADIIPLYEQCGAVVVPLLTGGGTRIKILEAGLARRPIISTEIGAYGLSLHDHLTFLSMNDYKSFKECCDWLKNRDNYTRLTEAMHLYVQENFTEKNFEQALDEVICPLKNRLQTQFTPGLVSVIIPVFNRAHLVGKTIASVLAQTYKQIEIIAVNDGSTDGSLGILTAYADHFPDKVRVIDQKNTGQVRARNVGIQHARGEFIAFLDSDDTWIREKLAFQIPLFKPGVGLVYCGIHEVDQDNRIIRTVPCETGLRGDIYHQLLIRNRMTGGSVVVSRTALEHVGLFDESLQAAENWDLWIRIAQNFKVNYVNQPLVQYLKHPGNMSSNSDRMSQSAWTLLQKHLPSSAARGELRQTWKQAYANFHYNQAVMYFSAGKYRLARSSFIACWRYRLLYRDSAVRMVRSLMGRNLNQLLSGCKTRIQLLFLKGRHDPASC